MSRDRFQVLVEQNMPTRFAGPLLTRTIATRLLRREHAALVRAVLRLRIPGRPFPHERLGYARAISDVLALLAKRKGGRDE